MMVRVVMLDVVIIVLIASMYGIFTYIYHKFKPNVGEYSIHGWYGVYMLSFKVAVDCNM